MLRPLWLVLSLLFAAFAAPAAVVGEDPFDQEIDHVYLTQGGKDFYMDIFRPTGENRKEFYKPTDGGKGLGIIDIVSGGWNTSRARLDEHKGFQVFSILCARGYTVFALRPGTKGEYIFPEMLDQINHGIRYIKAHAAEYGVDPDRLGLMGASAGGHLTCMTALNPQPADPDSKDPLMHFDTTVAAAGAFFPPTDFLHWDTEVEGGIAGQIGELLFKDGIEGKTQEEIDAAAKKYSPLYYVTADAPPFFLLHGDADPVVPLSQSEALLKALKDAGVQADLLVKEGGTHPWITLPNEVIILADWFDKTLAKK
ncbi:MAG: prolyl oligopeptidase family serine peptidase [Candidatus Hydrogenedens sp.]|nr:prolyl oligopeptidase family serine peptidase [Candidatus Hydrogenedens sp.]